MKLLIMLTLAFATSQSSFAADKKTEINPYGKHFEGDGVEVDMALFSEKNSDGLQDALLKIKGASAHDAGIDGDVMKYEAQHGGTGINFNYKKGKEEKTRMLSRNSWGNWSFFEVFLDGKSHKVYLDEKKSKDVKPEELLSKYKSAKK